MHQYIKDHSKQLGTATLLSLFAITPQFLVAQTAKGSKPKAAVAKVGGNFVSGYSYVLPRNYHLQYRAVSDKTVATGKKTDDHVPYSLTKIIVKKADVWYIPGQGTNIYGTLPKVTLKPGKAFYDPDVSFNEFNYGSFTEKTELFTPTLPAPTTYNSAKAEIVTETTRTIETDTIDRYHPGGGWQPSDPFKLRRLRVAVTPADSGRLIITVKSDINFAEKRGIDNVHFVRYSPTNEISPAIPISKTDSSRNFYLTISGNELVGGKPRYLSLKYSVLQYGAVTIPFKYRFKNDRFLGGYTKPTEKFPAGVTTPSEASANLNVAFYVGRKIGRTRFYYDPADNHNTISVMFSAFAGPSLYDLTAKTVNYDTDLNKVPAKQLALSTGGAFSLEWKSVSLGLFCGFDIPVEKTDWVYRYKPWLGVGIGVSLGMFTNGNSLSQVSGK